MKELAQSGRSMREEDGIFHRVLAELAENRVLVMILELFW